MTRDRGVEENRTGNPLPPVALDAMGGDRAPSAQVAGAAAAARQGYPVLLVGDSARLEPLVPRDVDLPILHADEVVEMHDAPSDAIRRKEGASIRVAVQAIKDGQACAAVCCGNTGAAMAASMIVLGRVPGVDRPAVMTLVPRVDGGSLVLLDLGANVDCKPTLLAQFAVLGHAFAQDVLHLSHPRVGLVSNGAESGKGNDQVRRAAELVSKLPLRFVGQVEPTVAFDGGCDVLVCDGFVGNIMLKTVESTVDVVGALLKEELNRRPSAKVGAWLLQGAFRRYRARTDYAAIGGALLLGVNGVVVVGHGRSDEDAVCAAIRQAHHCAAERLAERLHQAMSRDVESTEPPTC